MISPRERILSSVFSVIGSFVLIAMASSAPVAAKSAVQQRTATVHIRTL